MKVKILDKNEISEHKKCYLCSVSLYDFLKSLEDNLDKLEKSKKNMDYKYLENLTKILFLGDCIPIITLVILNEQCNNCVDNNLTIDKFEILDGLHIALELNIIAKLSEWLITNFETNESIEENFVNDNMRSLTKEKRQEIIECGVADFKQAKNIAKQIIDTIGIKNVEMYLKEKSWWIELCYK